MIDFERWDEIKPVVQGALDLPEPEREAYLDEACQGDQELRRQADALLSVSATRADVYDNFVVVPLGLHAADFKEGEEIGAYRIVRPLGTGGMSTVYLADDPRHGRQVALKVLRAPRRRHHEERTVARFDHPHIVTFHDSGQVEAGPAYFVMEYIDGEPITTYCETKGLSIEERLRLFLSVCDAVAYAHRHLVVHRDLKPANILVNNEGKPKLLDFGIAKSLSPSLAEVTVTAPEDRALTVAFASPEQLTGETTSTATDIYSLGVLLCLLLTGRLPYAVKSAHELAMAIRVADPRRPSQLVKGPSSSNLADERVRSLSESETRKLERTLRGDLDAIVLKALRKEPDRRYSTVAELAADVHRYFQSEPVSARRGSRRYRAGKFIQRHRPMVFLSAIAALVFIGLLIGLAVQLREIARQRDTASENAKQTQTALQFLTDLFDKTNSWSSSGQPQTPEQFIDQAVERLDQDFKHEPQMHARLLTVIADIYGRLSKTEKAAQLLKIAVRRQVDTLPSTHSDIGDTLHVVGAVAIKDKRLDDADVALSRSLEIAESQDSTNPATVASLLGDLALLRLYQEKPVEAEALARRAIAMSQAHPREANKHLDNALHQLSRALRAQDRFDEAAEILSRVIRLRNNTYGPEHPSTAVAIQTLSHLYHDIGDHAQEASEAKKALAIMEATLPPDNPDRLNLVSTVAGALAHLGQYQESERLYRQVLEVLHRTLPPNHIRLGPALSNVGYSLMKQEKPQEALSFFLEALAVTDRTRGRNVKDAAIMLDNIGVCRFRLGQFKESDAAFQEALKISRATFGASSVGTALTLKSYGKTLLQRSSFIEATKLLLEATDILAAKLPNDHTQLAQSRVLLGSSYSHLGDRDRAEKLLFEGYRVLSTDCKSDRRLTREALEQLEAHFERWGQPTKAADYRRLLATDLAASQ